MLTFSLILAENENDKGLSTKGKLAAAGLGTAGLAGTAGLGYGAYRKGGELAAVKMAQLNTAKAAAEAQLAGAESALESAKDAAAKVEAQLAGAESALETANVNFHTAKSLSNREAIDGKNALLDAQKAYREAIDAQNLADGGDIAARQAAVDNAKKGLAQADDAIKEAPPTVVGQMKAGVDDFKTGAARKYGDAKAAVAAKGQQGAKKIRESGQWAGTKAGEVWETAKKAPASVKAKFTSAAAEVRPNLGTGPDLSKITPTDSFQSASAADVARTGEDAAEGVVDLARTGEDAAKGVRGLLSRNYLTILAALAGALAGGAFYNREKLGEKLGRREELEYMMPSTTVIVVMAALIVALAAYSYIRRNKLAAKKEQDDESEEQ